MKSLLKIFLIISVIWLGLPLSTHAQSGYTQVTATVLDTNGSKYANAPYTVTFFDPGTSGKLPLLNGSTFQKSYNGYATDGNGKLSISLPDNGIIASSSGATGTQWTFSICTAVGAYTTQFCIPSTSITITGNSQDISAALTAVAPLLPKGLTPGNPTGSFQYNCAGSFCGTSGITPDSASSGFLFSPETNDSSCTGGLFGFYYNSATGTFRQCISGTPSNLGGGTPGTPTNSVQLNCSPGVFCGTIGILSPDKSSLQIGGPDPYVDITAPPYNARATDYNQDSVTVTVNASSTSATLNRAGAFQNGDYINIVGAGSGNSVGTSAPSAPTVTAVYTGNPLGTEWAGGGVGPSTGSTTYSYEIMWCDLATMACTPPSALTTITNGQATIGRLSASITSISRSGTTATVTTSSAYNFGNNAEVIVKGGSDATFTGFQLVESVPDSTHFTYTTPGNTASGASTNSTGGTVEWFLGNKVACGTAPTTTSVCYIYGRTSGSLTLIGNTVMGWGDFVDWGSTLSANPVDPSWVPSTPPSTYQNNALSAKVTAGAGTTSVTLSTPASTSVTSRPGTIDMCPPLQTAATAAINSEASLYIPPTAATSRDYFMIGSYCSLPGGLRVQQAGSLLLSDTLELVGAGNWWTANRQGGNATLDAEIAVGAVSPGIHLSFSGLGSTIDGWRVRNTSANNGINVLADIGNYNTIEHSNFTDGSGSAAYMAVNWLQRGSGFDTIFDKDFWFAEVPNASTNLGDVTTPTIFFLNKEADNPVIGTVFFMDNYGYAKGIAAIGQDHLGGFDGLIDHFHIQGPVNPILTTNSTGDFVGPIKMSHVIADSTAAPMLTITNGNPFSGTVILDGDLNGSDTNGYVPLTSGQYITDLQIRGEATCCGAAQQNFDVTNLGPTSQFNNVKATGTVDFSAASSFTTPHAAGLTSTGPAQIGFDDTAGQFWGQYGPILTGPRLNLASASVQDIGNIPVWGNFNGFTSLTDLAPLGGTVAGGDLPLFGKCSVGVQQGQVFGISASGEALCQYLGIVPNAQTSTYTLAGDPGGDRGKDLYETANVNIPQAGSAGFPSGYFLNEICNNGTSAITATPTTSTISTPFATGLTSISMGPGSCWKLSVGSATGNGIWNMERRATVLCSGTVTLGTSAIGSAAKGNSATSTCTGLATTDSVVVTSNAELFGITGFAPSASGILTINCYPTANTVNCEEENNTGGSITPSAVTVNYQVMR